ncbi:MAG: family 16 glycoside hydrolase [Planctomycetota bacterium]
MIGALLLASLGDPSEADFYRVDWLIPPQGSILEVGGMDFLPDGRLALSTRRGQVWLVENAMAENPADARFSLFAEGLQEGLGLTVVDGAIHVLQRGEISKLADDDGDGRCDRIDTLCDAWGVSGHYHEFAFGLPRDAAGNFFVSLNVSFGDPKWWHGRSTAPWRGWVMKVTPQGELEPYALGFRSPCGLGFDEEGNLFETDNQGDWMPSCPIFHVKPGRFYGHPASLAWTSEYLATKTTPSDTIPPERAREPAAVWIPYKWSRSAGNLAPDTTAGKFGPFAHQLFVAELTNGMIVRTQLERVRGELQGACFLFRQRVGSAIRVLFAPDGTLFAGLTNRGWGGLAPGHGVARIRWTGRTPFEIRAVHLLKDGFEVTFTEPIAPEPDLRQVAASMYHYDWWWEYGSPERGNEKLEIAGSELSSDRTRLSIRFSNLRAGEIARVVLNGVRSAKGDPLLHPEFDYTINQLPEGPICTTPVARLVPPPPARESGDEGWLRLCYTDAFGLWESTGWSLVEAELDPEDPKKFLLAEGNGALVNDGSGDFVSQPVFGDLKLHAELMLPEGGGGGVMLMGRYEVRLSADASFGSIAGRGPALESFKGPGQWHDLDLVFRAPRFDAQGGKVENARFEKVLVDDILLHEGLELTGPTEGGLASEAPAGPLRFRGDRGLLAMRGIQVLPMDEPADEPGFVPLFDGEGLEGWTPIGEAAWTVEDEVLVGSGRKGLLATVRDDYGDFELSARMKISDGGRSAIRIRGAEGYEAVVNSSYPDEEHTGSLRGLHAVKPHLVAPNTWFDYGIRCEEEAEGTRIRISIQGIVVTDVIDRERKFRSGSIAIEQHHEGSIVEIRSLSIRELRR